MRSVIVVALLLLFAAPAIGQSANDRLISEALRAMDIAPSGWAIQDAVDEAFAELLPGERFNRYRINRTQARAIAYIAATIAANYDVGPANDPPEYGDCSDAAEAAYDLVASIPPRGSGAGLFINDEEKEIIRDSAAEIRSMASSCGCFALADAALGLPNMVAETLPDRDDVVEALDDLRVAATSCR